VLWQGSGVIDEDVASRGMVVIMCDMIKNVGQDVRRDILGSSGSKQKCVAGFLGTR
jgi:hypothetical protein